MLKKERNVETFRWSSGATAAVRTCFLILLLLLLLLLLRLLILLILLLLLLLLLLLFLLLLALPLPSSASPLTHSTLLPHNFKKCFHLKSSVIPPNASLYFRDEAHRRRILCCGGKLLRCDESWRLHPVIHCPQLQSVDFRPAKSPSAHDHP
jgi:hypothetical protein